MRIAVVMTEAAVLCLLAGVARASVRPAEMIDMRKWMARKFKDAASLAAFLTAIWTLAMGSCICMAQEQQGDVQVKVVDFVEKTIYHSPETPGYTSWVGLWQLPNGTVCCDFRQVTGPKDKPVSIVPVLGSQDAGATWAVLTATAPSADLGMLGGYTVSSDGCRGMAVLSDGTLVRPAWPSSDMKDSGYVLRSADQGRLGARRYSSCRPKNTELGPRCFVLSAMAA